MKTATFFAAALVALAASTAAHAQEETEEAQVSTEKIWTFDDYAPIDNGDKEFVGTADESLWEMDGLYIRNYSGRYCQMYNGNNSGTFSDGKSWSCAAYVRTQGNTSFLADGRHDTSAGCKVVKECDRCLAFNAAVAGTCYVVMKPNTIKDGVDNSIFFNHALGEVFTVTSQTSTKEKVELKYTSEEPGSFFIVPGVNSMIYVVRFVPTANSSGIEEISTAANNTDNSYYDLTGRKVANPQKGLFIHRGKKVAVK
jgi:hypothetical protein